MDVLKTPTHTKAHTTGRWAETIFRALSSRIANRWKFVSFRGVGKGEWRGVVDLIAIRKDRRKGKSSEFSVLGRNLNWKLTTSRELFE